MNAIGKIEKVLDNILGRTPRVVNVIQSNPVHFRPVKSIMAVYAYKPKEVEQALEEALWLCYLSMKHPQRPPKQLSAKYLGTLPKPMLHHMLGQLSKFM